MKNLLSILVVLILISCSKEKGSSSIDIDGIYYFSFKENGMEGVKHYLKFNSDSTVYGVSSSGDIEFVNKIIETSLAAGTGKYNIVGDSIKFDLMTQNGRVEYCGIIEDSNKLNLKVISHINGHISQNEYIFTPNRD